MADLPLEEVVIGCPKVQQNQQEGKVKPAAEQSLKCPRCESTNTKFCYYNNYSLSQPRYFCKGCRRYWTKGGTLRNVPVGGGCRKNKKCSSSSKRPPPQDQQQPFISTSYSNPSHLFAAAAASTLFAYDPNDHLTLALARLNKQQHNPGQLLDDHETNFQLLGNPNPEPNLIPDGPRGPAGFLDMLRADNPSAFHNLYSTGYGGNNEVVMLPFGDGLTGGATTTTATTVTTSQTSCKGLNGGEDKMLLMGLQWQVGGDCCNMDMGAGRDHYWNGVGSNWHGVINSSLM